MVPTTLLNVLDQKPFLKEISNLYEKNGLQIYLVGGAVRDGILGIDTKGRVVYSVNKIVETFMERDGMTDEEAIEFFDFNVDGAHVGEYTPIYIYEE